MSHAKNKQWPLFITLIVVVVVVWGKYFQDHNQFLILWKLQRMKEHSSTMSSILVRPLNLLLLLFVVGTVVQSTCAAMTVTSPEDLGDLFNTTTSTLVVADIVLLADLDFEGSSVKLPLGLNDGNTCTPFSGTLDGMHHNIKNIKQASALFCELANATINNLVFNESCEFDSSVQSCGALSAKASGTVPVTNVQNNANVSAFAHCGGLIGLVKEQSNITLLHNTNRGTVSCNVCGGGLVGYVERSSTIVVEMCHNHGTVSTTSPYDVATAGGLIGFVSEGAVSQLVVVQTLHVFSQIRK